MIIDVGDVVRVLTTLVKVIPVVGLIATVIKVGALIGRAIVNAGHRGGNIQLR